jgi:hypothetical protein
MLIFVSLFAFALSTNNNAFAQTIADPGVPTAAPPPVIPPERDPVRLRKQQKIEQQQTEEIKAQDQRKEVEVAKSEELKKKEASQPRPLYGFVELSLAQPLASVSQGRSDYRYDMTTTTNLYARTYWNSEASDLQPWVGFRIAPLNGYGKQGKTTARFSHLWMGPAVGFGYISKPSEPESDYPTRNLFLASAGVAGVSRLAAESERGQKVGKDFESSAWSMDPPGIWSELRWSHVFMGAIGCGAIVGVQTGSGKIIYYAGATLSGFY